MSLEDESSSYQVVGVVMAHQAYDGYGTERLTPHTGTETLSGHLRVAAVENLRQCAQA